MDRGASTYELAARSCEAAIERAKVRLSEAVQLETRRVNVRRHNWTGAAANRIYSDWISSLASATDELSGSLKQLRARARELSRNNPYAGGYVEDLSTNVVGPSGVRMRAKVRDRNGELATEINREIERAWRDWAEGPVTADGTLNLLQFEDLCFQTMVTEGECFVRRLRGPQFRHGLALQIIDADLVDDSYTRAATSGREPEIYMGVEVDHLGRRLAYHVLDYYQYGPGYQGRGRLRIPATEVLHLFRPKRANQMRGFTWLARVMAALHDLGRYNHSELVASGLGASQMGFIINEGGPIGGVSTDAVVEGGAGGSASGGATPSRDRVVLEAEPGTVRELDYGQKFQEWSLNHPNQAYGDFVDSNLHSVSAGLDGATYESLSTDYSQVTYLSERAARIRQRAIVERLQVGWISMNNGPIADWWLQSSLLTGDLDLPGGDWRLYRSRAWSPYVPPWVDPSKDAEAFEKLLALGLASHSEIAAARGKEFEEVCEERKRDREVAARHGEPLRSAAAPAAGGPPSPRGGEDGDDPNDAPYDADAARKRGAREAGRNGTRSASRIAVRQ